MGIVSAKFDSKIRRENNNIKSCFDPAETEPVLTEKEGNLLKEVWENIKEDIHKVGVITFVR